MKNGTRPSTGDAPLDYRRFLVVSPTMTWATAVITALRTFSTHFFAMSGTKPLRSGGPAEGGGGGWRQTTYAGMRRARRKRRTYAAAS